MSKTGCFHSCNLDRTQKHTLSLPLTHTRTHTHTHTDTPVSLWMHSNYVSDLASMYIHIQRLLSRVWKCLRCEDIFRENIWKLKKMRAVLQNWGYFATKTFEESGHSNRLQTILGVWGFLLLSGDMFKKVEVILRFWKELKRLKNIF